MTFRFLPLLFGAVAISGCSGQQARIEEDVKRELRDPESAQFRDVKPCAKPDAWQGEVNSKNGFGGYAGYRPFIWVKGQVAFLGGDEASPQRSSTTMAGLDEWNRLTRLCWADEVLKEVDAQMQNLSSGTDATASELELPPVNTSGK